MCVGGALPRVGDRGNRREGREGRSSEEYRKRKEGRMDLDGSRSGEMDEGKDTRREKR